MGPRFVSAGGATYVAYDTTCVAFNGAALRQRGRPQTVGFDFEGSDPSMGPRFVSAGGPKMLPGPLVSQIPSMGPRFVSAGGASNGSMARAKEAFNGAALRQRGRRRRAPRANSATSFNGAALRQRGRQKEIAALAEERRLQWGRASSAREAHASFAPVTNVDPFNGAALRQRGRPGSSYVPWIQG